MAFVIMSVRNEAQEPKLDCCSRKTIVALYLEGQGDLVSRLITPITHIVTPVIPRINLLTKFPLTLQVVSEAQLRCGPES